MQRFQKFALSRFHPHLEAPPSKAKCWANWKFKSVSALNDTYTDRRMSAHRHRIICLNEAAAARRALAATPAHDTFARGSLIGCWRSAMSIVRSATVTND